MIISLAVARFLPGLLGEVGEIAPPAVFATISGGQTIMSGDRLTGTVTGGVAGQVIEHRWLANDAVIAGEAAPDLVVVADGNVPTGAVLRYAPAVDGQIYQSAAVQLAAPVEVSLSGAINGEILPDQTLIGLISGGLADQTVFHIWTADGAELATETGPSLTPQPDINVPADAVLRYTPLVDGVAYSSDPVQLVLAPQALVMGDTSGLVLPEQQLSGVVAGGLSGKVIDPRWTANDAVIAGETTPLLVPQPGVNVPAEAQLCYTPLVDGEVVVSPPVQLVSGIAAAVSGDTGGYALPAQVLTGAVMGGLPTQVIQHRWLADGVEVAGEAEATLVLQPDVTVPPEALIQYAPLVDGVEVLADAVQLVPVAEATLSGDANGLILPEQSLFGAINGGIPGQSVQHRWLADGAVIPGEASTSFIPEPGVNVAADALLAYAPLVDGVQVQSGAVQLVPDASVTVSGDTNGYVLPAQGLTGSVTGGLPGQVVQYRWLADDAEVAGETADTLIPEPGVNVPAQAVLRYAPLIDGVAQFSGAVQLAAAIEVSISGDAGGAIAPYQALTGGLSGGLPGQQVLHRWRANGVQIVGEIEVTFVPQPGVNVPAGSALTYAPRVDGTLYASREVQLSAAQEAPSQSLPRLIGAQRMGAEITLDGSMLTGVSARRYYLDGVEIQGQTGPSITAMFMGALTCEVVADEGTFITPPLHILMNHMMAGHNATDDAVLALVAHGDATHIAIADGNWMDAAIWDVGTVPHDGAVVLVPFGRTVRYDVESSPRLDRVRIDGTLTWALDRSTDILVETIVVPPSGKMVIGDALQNRLPPQYSAIVSFSNRAYRIDAAAPTNLDLANDPTLIGRGLLALGEVTIFGHHREPHVKTAQGALPMAGDTSCMLDHVPKNWAVGDTVVIPGTAVDLDAAGVNRRYDEERVVTQISGALISWSSTEPLLFDHGLHNDKIDTVAAPGDTAQQAANKARIQAEIDGLQLPIVVKDRNVILKSEAGLTVHRRGHLMIMHGASRADIWDAAMIEMGRTDKSKPTGVINADGAFQYIPSGTKDFATTPLTADANLISRYPAHLHFCGYDKPVTDLIRDCFVEDARAWAMVHHGCRADWLGNVMYRYQGSGMVSETGDELGRWDNNLTIGLETLNGAYRFPKGQEEKEGKFGDFGKWGYGFYYRGRAMVVTRNIAIGGTWGHVFYHRGSNNGFGDGKDTLRKNADLNDLTFLLRDRADIIARVDYPIIHFDANESIGCVGAMAVVKNSAKQYHDLNIKISKFLGWGVWRGVILNYIGSYLVQDVTVLSSDFDGQVRQVQPAEHEGFSTGKSNQVALDGVISAGFHHGITFSGNAVQGISNVQFSQDDPRFILGEYTETSNTIAVAYSDAGSDPTPTQSVTRILTSPVDREARPTVALDFIIAEYTGSNQLINFAQAIKSDTVSNGGVIPKPWDSAGIPDYNNSGIRIREILEDYGYWTYQGDNIVLAPLYFSDRANALSIKHIHAIRCTGNLSAYVNNGAFTRSASDPVRADVTRAVTGGVADMFNVLDAATGDPGTTLSLDIPWMTNNAVIPLPKPAHLKTNYGAFSVSADGTVTYIADPEFSGRDTALVYVYDGQGRFATVAMNYDVTPA